MCIILSKIFPGRLIWEIGLQSSGFLLFNFVLGIGVTLLRPHVSGKIPCCKHELYTYVNSKVMISKASFNNLVLSSSIAEDLDMHISFTCLLTSASLIQVKLNEESTVILQSSFFHSLSCYFANVGPTLT